MKPRITLTLVWAVLAFIFHVDLSYGQSSIHIKGVVFDNETKLPLPFASVVAHKAHIGTTTDTLGRFSLLVNSVNDSLSFSYIGYEEQTIAVSEIKDPSTQIFLNLRIYSLKEYTVKPMSALEYVQSALQNVKENYDSNPFYLVTCMQNNLYENKKMVSSIETVYKTYYHDKSLTALDGKFESEHQIMLFRKKENLPKWTFMKEEITKMNKKKKYLQDKNPMENDTLIQLGLIPLILPIYTHDFPFLDSNQFHQFSYTKEEECKKGDLVVIDIKPKKKASFFDHVDFKGSGKLYIDCQTNAIIKLNFNAQLKVPFLIRTFIWLKFKKLKVKYIDVQGSIEFKQNDNKYWYPYTTQFWGKVDVEKTNWFSKNDKATIEFTSTYLVNRILFDNSYPITPEKKYSFDKINLQNDMNLRWEDISKRSIDLY